MKIVSTAEMREIDRVTSAHFGVPSLTLMENAGTSVAEFILSEYSQAHRIGIVCGKGNNGGDGFVVARKLAEAGRAVRLLLLADPQELRGDAGEMFRRMNATPIVVKEIAQFSTIGVEEAFSADLIVDAILGTGFRPPVSPLYAAAIQKLNVSAAAVVAVDIPSGAEADSMKPISVDARAKADAIVTFTAPRPAHLFDDLTDGPTIISSIGSPAEAIHSDLGLNLSAPAAFSDLLTPRKREANKGSYGHVMVIGGSMGKAGAAAMAGFAALRSGAGLSTVATASSVVPTVSGFHPELMTESLAETKDGTIAFAALTSGRLAEVLERKTVVAVGPGLSRNAETVQLVQALLEKCSVPMVLDADALNAFEDARDKLRGHEHTLVVTPHPGEMSRLTGLSIAEIQNDRIAVARKFAREHDVILVLKGHRTLVAAPDGAVWVNPTGNPGMATGGTGDVLTGMISGMIAQHPGRALEATALAVYLHGLAGDLACERLGEESTVATDLIRFLPGAFRIAKNKMTGIVRIHA